MRKFKVTTKICIRAAPYIVLRSCVSLPVQFDVGSTAATCFVVQHSSGQSEPSCNRTADTVRQQTTFPELHKNKVVQ